MKKWIPFIIGGRLPPSTSPEAVRLAAIMQHNLKLLGPAGPSRTRDVAEVDLDALHVEMLEAYETVASLVADLEFERARVTYLEERLAEFEDAAEAARRARPPLRIVSITSGSGGKCPGGQDRTDADT